MLRVAHPDIHDLAQSSVHAHCDCVPRHDGQSVLEHTCGCKQARAHRVAAVSYTHLRAHETSAHL
eukprot:13348118-Alexandrium_andersonii.AAC.1